MTSSRRPSTAPAWSATTASRASSISPGWSLGEQNGKLTVNAPVELLGQQFTLHGVGELVVDEAGKVRMRFENLTADGLPDIPLAQTLLTNYARQLSIEIPLPVLPYEMRVTEVRPLPEGLRDLRHRPGRAPQRALTRPCAGPSRSDQHLRAPGAVPDGGRPGAGPGGGW